MSQTISKMISSLLPAFDNLDEIGSILKNKRLAVFLDYDGTLAPITEKPELASMAPSMRAAVSELSKHCMLAIVSGRDLSDIQKQVGINDLIYAGGHGFDICGPDGLFFHYRQQANFENPLKNAKEIIHRELAAINGILIEIKKLSIAVHYRQVDEADRPKVAEVVDAILADHRELRVTPGKMVYEIQPKVDWNKGKAVLYILDALGLGGPGVVSVYVGDDITDEDAFRAIDGVGIGIFTGNTTTNHDRATAADYFVCDQDELCRLLQYLTNIDDPLMYGPGTIT